MFATLRSCFCNSHGEASVAPLKQHPNELAADAQPKEIEPPTVQGNVSEETKKQNGPFDLHEGVHEWLPSADDQELIRRTWSDDFERLYEIGLLIYTNLFDDHPITKNFFPSIHEHGDTWKQSQEFRHQALSFAKTVSYVVQHMTSHEALASYLNRVGARHVEYGNRFDTRFEQPHWDLIQFGPGPIGRSEPGTMIKLS
ncbi:Protein GLB-18 a [Aphelenchoides avenae]|nr:Protein GLB-18 a [Aphelenchus avenae]